MAIRVYLEVAPKKTFASALDWPGWSRSGRTEEAALDAIVAYARRYAPVATRAGERFPASASAGDVEVVERVDGNATTEFGAPGMPASADDEPLSAKDARRLAALVEASWAVLDDVAAVAPAELRKGPRGGGRDRDKIVHHVVEAEASYLRKIGVKVKAPAPGDGEAVAAMRAAALEALTAARAPRPEGVAKPWPWRYAARRIAWHALDHAWEIEDRSEPA